MVTIVNITEGKLSFLQKEEMIQVILEVIIILIEEIIAMMKDMILIIIEAIIIKRCIDNMKI